MKKTIFFSRLNIMTMSGLLLFSLLFSACKKGLDNTGTQTPVAGLIAFNLVPDKDAVGVALSGSNFTNSPLSYTNYTGSYRGVYVGNRQVESYDFSSGATLDTTLQVFEPNAYYSVFVAGANGKYKNIVVKDNVDSLSSTTGEAFVRYVNAIPDSTGQPLVTVSSNGTNVFNNSAAFATVSDFKGITPGDVSVKVNNESTINSNRTITLETGKIYTVLLVGIPGATDSTKAVQIKYIQNGSISQ
jgi:hypothetical protein